MINIAKELPAEKIEDMRIEGLSDDDIINALKPNHSNQNIKDAMNQAKQEIPEDNVLEELDQVEPDLNAEDNEELIQEAPSPESGELQQETYSNYQDTRQDQTQEIVESVIEEKWDDLISKVGDLNMWKEGVNNDIESVKQEILRLQERISNLQNVMLGKVTEYSKGIYEIGTEMKALEQVFQRILLPLTTNIRDLNKVTEELKSHKKSKKKK